MSIPYNASDTTITVVIGFAPRVVPKSHPNFDAIREALENGADEQELEPLLSIPKAIEAFTDGDVLVKNGKLYYKGYEVKSKLANLILKFSAEGKETAAAPFKSFLAKAHANPDPRAQTDLFEWVVASGLPITPDGDILAWKAVAEDYRSIHAPSDERFDHRIGNIVEQDRTTCDANPAKTCSAGLHFCSGPYLKNYGGGGSRVVAVKISPTDVVAFPTDYGWEKGRACRYQVVGEVPTTEVKDFYPQGRRIYTGFDAVKAPAAKKAPVTSAPNAETVRIVQQNDGLFALRQGRKTLAVYYHKKDAKRGALRRGLTV